MPTENEIQKRAEEIQNEIHRQVEAAMPNTEDNKTLNLQYQDCTNVCIFRKLAELELKIEEMQNWKENNYI